MDLRELEAYRLSDAVKFHPRLNPRIWGPDEKMLPEVRERLLAIADDFRESLGIDVQVKDITISGSNAAYTYTPQSDIDLHLVADLPEADSSDVYRELFDAKKYQYNDEHDYKIGAADVELYVQDANKPHYSQGIYSIKDDRWLSVPKRRRPEIDDISVRSKYEDIGHRIDQAIESGDLARMDRMAEKIRTMRQSGLEQTGEFGPENLAFKVLRNNGTLQRLRTARQEAKSRELSLNERKKKSSGSRKRWGVYGGYYYPGFGYYGSGEAAGEGGGDGGGESREVKESRAIDLDTLLDDFVKFVSTQLGLEQVPRIRIKRDPQWSRANNTFGRYVPEEHTLYLSVANRHPLDVMRTMAHELTHHRQAEIEAMPDHAGETGSRYENQANAMAGILMRQWADLHPEMFSQPITEGGDEDTGDFPAQSGGKMPGQPIPFPKGTVKVDVSDVYDWYKLGQHISDLGGLGKHDFGQGPPQTVLSFGSEPVEHEYIQNLAKIGLKTHDIDEGLRGKLGAAAAAACIAGTPGCATTDITAADALRGVQAVGRAAQATKPYGTASRADVIRAGAEEELRQELKNILRKGTGTGDQSRVREADEPLMRLDDPIVNYDVPYSAIARPERLHQVRRFGRISHYGSPAAASAIISVPVSKEPQFQATMRNLSIPVKKSEVYEASGYIPTAKEKDDPRYKMALTVDVRPGQTGKEANKLGLKTDSQGRPQLLMKRLENLLEAEKSNVSPTVQALYREMWSEVEDLIHARQSDTTNPHHIQSLESRIQEIQQELAGEGYRFDYTTGRLQPLNEACWKGYRRQGMKKKGRRMVPNCVPVSEAEEDLFEVKMSPTALEQWAKSPEAAGIQAGFEAELIFRGTNRDDDQESEPDYDADERADSIEGVIDFFTGGENGIGRNTANRLRDGLYEEWADWREEAIQAAWENDEEDHVLAWMEENVWAEDKDLYRERAAEALGIDLDAAEPSAEQTQAIEAQAREEFERDVATTIEEQDDDYRRAREEFRDNAADNDPDYDEESFLQEKYRYMSEIADAFSLDWPYWTEGSYGGDGRSQEDIADSLSSALGGAEVKAGGGYHSTTRRPGRWIVEPDGSLDPDDYEDAGLEIVSPPMPLPDALTSLRTVIDWANGDGDAYTNGSTGLHMGVSIPYKGGDVDYVKLILFMGDQYVLDQFDRAANHYTRSALEKLQDVQRSRRRVRENVTGWDNKTTQSMTGAEKTAAAMDLMRKNLIELAQRYVQDGVGRDKYTSAHIKPGYIEFRSPGGDYLSMDSRDEQSLANTMLRFARAMQIAGRPDLERKEYSKKLYKLLSGFRSAELTKSRRDTRYRTQIETEGDNDALELFAKYSAGLISPEILKKEWARQVLAKEQPPPQAGDKYEIYRTDTGEVLDVITGRDEGEIGVEIAGAVERFSGQGFEFKIRKQGEREEEPSRRVKVAKRIQQTPAQAADNRRDSAELQQRVIGEFPYRVTWSENGREDSLNTTARSAEAAEENLRSTLDVMGRRPDPGSLRAVPRAPAGYERGLSQQDQPQAQAGRGGQQQYEIYDANTRDAVEVFTAASDDEALERLWRYRASRPGWQFGVRVVHAEPRQSAQREYQIYDTRTGDAIVGFMAADNQEATARVRLYREQHPNANVSVRLGGTSTQTQPQGGIDPVPEML